MLTMSIQVFSRLCKVPDDARFGALQQFVASVFNPKSPFSELVVFPIAREAIHAPYTSTFRQPYERYSGTVTLLNFALGEARCVAIFRVLNQHNLPTDFLKFCL